MKQLLNTLSIVVLLGLGACSQAESPLDGSNEEVKVTFTAQLPQQAATRAEGDEQTSTPLANTLVVGIYEAKENVDPKLVKTDTTKITDDTITHTVTLIKGTTYKVVFWAYNKPADESNATTPYDVTDLTAITIEDGAEVSYDAFTACQVTVGGATTNNTNVTLTRPLAQVNVATTVADYKAAGDLSHTPATAVLTLTGCPKKFNALTGEVTGTETISLSFACSITAPESDASDETEVPFATGYTFAKKPTIANETSTPQKITCGLVVKDNAATPEEFFTAEYSNIPIQPNYRTNISGRLMTGTVSYSVSVNGTWNGSDQNINPDEQASTPETDN